MPEHNLKLQQVGKYIMKIVFSFLWSLPLLQVLVLLGAPIGYAATTKTPTAAPTFSPFKNATIEDGYLIVPGATRRSNTELLNPTNYSPILNPFFLIKVHRFELLLHQRRHKDLFSKDELHSDDQECA